MASGSGAGSGGSRHGCGSSGLRKAKKQRTPKRGPGVAELEKILREQDQQKGSGIGRISSSSSSLVPSIPVTEVHCSCYGIARFGCGTMGASGGSKGVYIGGSGVFLPEQTLLPISWGSSSSGTTRKHEEAPKTPTGVSFPMLVSNVSPPPPPPPPLSQKSRHHSMMELFPLSATAKTTTPPSSAGLYHQIEPPSNQKPSHYSYISSLFPEEDKIMDTKRTRPSFPVENCRPEPTRSPFRPILPQVSKLDPLSSANSNGVFNFGLSRDQGNPSGNSSRPTTVQNCQPDLSKFNKQFPFHENTEGTLLQRSSEPEPDVPVYNKGFFSFLLQPEELPRGDTSAEPTPCLQTEMCSEKTGEFLDLNLKL